MAEEAKNKASASKFRTSIGGQALIEGVLMRGPGKQAIVVRSPDGLVEKVEELTLVRDKYPVLGLPIIRANSTSGLKKSSATKKCRNSSRRWRFFCRWG